VGMDQAAGRRLGTYSTGMIKRISLAQALVHDPELLVLDEPTAGVDPRGVAVMADLIRQLREAGKTVILTSHLLSQVADLCDQVALLDRGRLVAQGTVEGLLGRADRHAVIMDALPAEEQASLQRWLEERGRKLHAIETPRAKLEQIFLAHTAGKE
jgi:ABC-2 type transport system ATP-binding protein